MAHPLSSVLIRRLHSGPRASRRVRVCGSDMLWKTATLFLSVAMIAWAIYEVRTERLELALLASTDLRPTMSNPGE